MIHIRSFVHLLQLSSLLVGICCYCTLQWRGQAYVLNFPTKTKPLQLQECRIPGSRPTTSCIKNRLRCQLVHETGNNNLQSCVVRMVSTNEVIDRPSAHILSESDVVDNFQQTMQRSVTLVDNEDHDRAKQSQKILTNIGSAILQLVLQSPIWKYVLVPMARQKIIDTAHANGIQWNQHKEWLLLQDGPWNGYYSNTDSDAQALSKQLQQIPSWYSTAAYHAYETGHLSWNAAIELELASAAIGARNIPQAGALGESMFRAAFMKALYDAGASRALSSSSSNNVEQTSHYHIVDIGCGTGTSTRLLGQMFSDSDHSEKTNTTITGIDLSPYFIQTGIRLHDLLASSSSSNGNKLVDESNDNLGLWVCTIPPDARIRYIFGDGTNLCKYYDSGSVDIVNVQFVFHELPVHVACNIIQESYRILKSNGSGQLWICEMDFESPAYKAQRNNPLLFSLVRSTEPYLDEYANGQSAIWQCLYDTFDTVTITAATGRHYAVVATKSGTTSDAKGRKKVWNDMRFDDNDQYRVDDTHLQVWENKIKANEE